MKSLEPRLLRQVERCADNPIARDPPANAAENPESGKNEADAAMSDEDADDDPNDDD